MHTKSEIQVDSTLEKTWSVLVEKAIHPDKFMSELGDFEIKEREENEFIRTIFAEEGDVIELIIMNPEEWTIKYNLVKHPFLKGTMVNRLEEREGTVFVVFETDREPTLKELAGLDMTPALEAAVLQIKEKVEGDKS